VAAVYAKRMLEMIAPTIDEVVRAIQEKAKGELGKLSQASSRE
jgi:hypothetical protein